MSAEQALSLEARNIGSIEVVKSELSTGRDTIFVTTADRMSDYARAKGTREKDVLEKVDRAIASKRMSVDLAARGKDAPLIMIDGKKATEAELAALNERDIASMAVYKGKDALNLRDDGRNGLEVTSRPADKVGVKTVGSVISITTKIARARANKQP